MTTRTTPIIIASLLILAFAPPGALAETKSADYDVPGGPSGNTGGGIAWNPIRCNGPNLNNTLGDGGCDIIDPERDGIIRISVHSVALRSDCGDCYTEFQVSTTDTLPTNAFYSFCIITDYQDGREDVDGGDNWCGEDPTSDLPDDIEDPRASGCATASLSSPVASGGSINEPTAFIYATYVDEATGNVCLASKGVLTVTMN